MSVAAHPLPSRSVAASAVAATASADRSGGDPGGRYRSLARLIRYQPTLSLEMIMRETGEKSERLQLERAAACLLDTYGSRTAMIAADRAREMALAGDWAAAKTWHRLFDIVFERMSAIDRPSGREAG